MAAGMFRWTRRAGLFALLLATCALLPCRVYADFTFVQVSDTHIAANAKDPGFGARYEEAIRQINALDPAFVIHTGDALTNFSAENYALFKEMSAKLKPKLYVAPGNHDVGNKLGLNGAVTEETYNAWVQANGCGHVSFEYDGCVFIGLTSALFNSGLAAEREQSQWLDAQLKAAGKKRIFVFQHAPVFETSPGEPSGGYNCIDEPVRSKLLKLFEKYKVEAVLYGHLHRFNESSFDGVNYIATPATSFSALTGYRVFRIAPGGFTTYFADVRAGAAPPEFGK